ncbi:MAG: type III pantothenate kinase [Gammaproteobacteria bacterium]
MILDLDLGNTRLKWRLSDQLRRVTPTIAIELRSVDSLPPIDPPEPITRIRIATVRGPAAEAALVSWARSRFGVDPEFARSSVSHAGLTNGYTTPELLGVDRWLALLAALRDGGAPAVVFDFGSAITVDAVSTDGSHLGGCIAPGIMMMQKGLLEGTDLVRFRPSDTVHIVASRNTSDAVSAGVLAAAVGFADELWWRLHARTGASFATITGGDVYLVAPHLRFPIVHRPDLVLDGLSVALP